MIYCSHLLFSADFISPHSDFLRNVLVAFAIQHLRALPTSVPGKVGGS